MTGRCPECGTEYPPLGDVLQLPPMSVWRRCTMLGWPAILLAGGYAFNLLSLLRGCSPLGGVGFALVVIGGLAAVPNMIVSSVMISQHHAPIGRTFGDTLARLTRRERIAVMGAAAAPVVVIVIAIVIDRVFW